jgi:hypothetical protein
MTFVTAACLLALPNLAKAQEETWSLTTTIPVPGLASFDISWVDATNHVYYLSDRTNKQIDTYTPSGTVGSIKSGNFVGAAVVNGAVNNDLSGPNGVLTFPNTANSGHIEVWAGDGPQLNAGCPTYLNGICSTVKVMDYNASGVPLTHVIPTNGAARADELCHDPVDHVVLIANGDEKDFKFGTPFITFISTDTYQITTQVLIPEASNGIEQCQYDDVTGLFFINIPEINGPGNDTADGATYVYDHNGNLVARYFIDIASSHCAGPQGMAIGPEPQILLGCNAPDQAGLHNSVVINKHTGATLSIAWGLGGDDEVWFDPTYSHYYLAQSSVTPPQLSIFDATGAAAVDQIISIPKIDNVSPHSVAADRGSGKVFWPNAGGVNVYTPSAMDSDDPASPAYPE